MLTITPSRALPRTGVAVLSVLLFSAASTAQFPQVPFGDQPAGGDRPFEGSNVGPLNEGPAMPDPAGMGPGAADPSAMGPSAAGPAMPGPAAPGAGPSTFAAPGQPGNTEELAAPRGDQAGAGDDADNDAGRQEVTVLQPTGAYSGATWLPDASLQAGGWMREIDVPPGLIDCTCGGQLPGPRCAVWRSLNKPTDPRIDPRCVVCVKEPYLDYETVTEEHRVIIHRCFESSEPFKHRGCEAGHCYEAKGTTTLRKLHTCEAKVPVKYLKPVVRHRDVYYYIPCKEDQVTM